ncbi:ATP-dependent DNA ligase [[Eubacterium] cellulosolvens]
MFYSELAEKYRQIETTTKRLEMTQYLVELFKKTPQELIDKVIYLTQGKIEPDYKGIELGVADKLAVRAIAFATGYTENVAEKQLIEIGDIGLLAEELVAKKKQRALFSEKLDINKVYESFHKIASATGNKSQELKFKLIAELLHDSEPIEAKYILRSLTGKIRLGIADMTILDALAIAFATKEDHDYIEEIYNFHPDLGILGKTLSREGLEGLKGFKVTVGIPLRHMLAERLSTIEEIFEKLGGKCAFEYKYDGLRIQAHITQENISLFTRHLENNTNQFPDIIELLRDSVTAKTAILEGECVPIDVKTGELLPFQMVSRRRGRKYEIESAVEEFPIKLFLFDCLYLDGEPLTNEPLLTRRQKLSEIIKPRPRLELSNMIITSDISETERFFNQSLDDGCEGLMAKSIQNDSYYRAGSRGWQWIKYKREYKSEMIDTVDLVVVGAFAGTGRRTGVYGALLMAVYNKSEDRFETICKLGTGFSDEMLENTQKILSEYRLDQKHPRVVSEMKADYWIEPRFVLEVLGAEITFSPIHMCAFGQLKPDAGLAIRFPRFTGHWREDKAPEDATTSKEIIDIYKNQLKKI